MPPPRLQVEWATPAGALRAFEPRLDEVRAQAPKLAAFYNEPYNQAMLSNQETLSAEDVVHHYRWLWEQGGRPFFLERDGDLIGDADLRRMTGRTAELAILIGARAVQGKGLGFRFGLMLHLLAFEALGLERLYASIIPENGPSRRLFEKLGYLSDDSEAARACADVASDLTLSLDKARFFAQHAAVLTGVTLAPRP